MQGELAASSRYLWAFRWRPVGSSVCRAPRRRPLWCLWWLTYSQKEKKKIIILCLSAISCCLSWHKLFAMERTGCVSQSSAWKPPLACFDQEQIAADRALGEVVPNNRKRSTTELHRKGFPRGAVGLAGEGGCASFTGRSNIWLQHCSSSCVPGGFPG